MNVFRSRAALALIMWAGCAGAAHALDAPTPAQHLVSRAQAATEQADAGAEAWAGLAMALARRARETGDTSHYEAGMEAVAKALELEPESLAAARARTWLLLGQHEFAAALSAAESFNERAPDDLMGYAFLTDANVELGRYEEAEAAAQWLLDMRPGNIPGLTRAAYLRELYGDIEGAIDLLVQAGRSTPAHETEQHAWLATHIGHLYRIDGKLDLARRYGEAALRHFPGYHYALNHLAEVEHAAGDHAAEVALRRRHYAAAPHPENLYLLGRALKRNGDAEQARIAFDSFEAAALQESTAADNANRYLVDYWISVTGETDRAITLASRERERRGDVFTEMAYAWALHQGGRSDTAVPVAAAAMRLGVQDPDLLYRAGLIAAAAGGSADARRFLTRALRVAPVHELADDAGAMLAAAEPVDGLAGAASGERPR